MKWISKWMNIIGKVIKIRKWKMIRKKLKIKGINWKWKYKRKKVKLKYKRKKWKNIRKWKIRKKWIMNKIMVIKE